MNLTVRASAFPPALALLLGSWLAIGQLGWSLPLLILGVIVLDFAVQAVHVSNQHVLTAAYADRTSSAIGGYMVFYSLGSAFGATATTALFDAAGWAGPTILGAALALCALATHFSAVMSNGVGRVRSQGERPATGRSPLTGGPRCPTRT